MEITKLKNIGAEMKRKLAAVGITSAEELQTIGSKTAFMHLKDAFHQVCLVHLYTLQGAIDNTEFNMLPQSVKDELKAFHANLE